MNWCTWYLLVEHTYINTHTRIYIYIYIYMHKGRYCKTYLTHSIGIYLWPLHETLRKLQIDFGRTETNVKFQGVSSEKNPHSAGVSRLRHWSHSLFCFQGMTWFEYDALVYQVWQSSIGNKNTWKKESVNDGLWTSSQDTHILSTPGLVGRHITS